jgi:hypothetical protein
MPVVVNPPFARLPEIGTDGKIKRIDGTLDILAIPRNPLIDQATRDKIRPLVQNWQAEVDQLAIDNLDFLEKIEPPAGGPGVIDGVHVNDQPSMHAVTEMMTQLMSAGPLSNHLEMKEGFSREQSQRNQEIVTDYLQQVMNEIMAAAKTDTEEGKVAQIDNVSRFLFYISCRDSIESYHRQLEESAAIMDQCVASLSLPADQKGKANEAASACKLAATPAEQRKAARKVLDTLTFDQRRAALSKARELLGPADPISKLGPSIPPPPDAGKPIASKPAPADAQPASTLPSGAQPIK